MLMYSVVERLNGLEQWSFPIVKMLLAGAVLVFVAYALTLLFRKRSASTKHLVWLSAFCVLAVLPISHALTPNWFSIPIQRLFEDKGNSYKRDAIGAKVSEAVPRNEASAAPAAPEVGIVAELPRENTRGRFLHSSNEPSLTAASRQKPIIQWQSLFVLVWLVGVVLFLIRLVVSHLRLVAWKNRDATESDHRTEQVASEIRRRLGMKSKTTILRGNESDTPMTWGIVSSHILIPSAAEAWSRDQLRTVLFHEHLHVVRRDPLKQLLVQLVCAVHWCNPLVWFAAGRIGEERERSCDDWALASGSSPCDYAEHLVRVASGRNKVVPALAMASSRGLEERVRAVLDPRQDRSMPGHMTVASVSVSMILTMIVLVAMLPGGVQAKPAPIETAAYSESPEERQADQSRQNTELFQGIDFESAPTTRVADATDFFTGSPLGYKATKQTWTMLIDDLAAGRVSTIYFRPDINKFLIQRNPIASSVLTYYGPFEGNPFLKLRLADFFLDQLRQPDKRLREEARKILAEAEAADFNPELTKRLRVALTKEPVPNVAAPVEASKASAIATPNSGGQFQVLSPVDTDSAPRFPTFSATAKSGITFFLDLENGRLVEIDLQKPHDEQEQGGFDVMVTPLDTYCEVGFARTAHLVSGPHTASSIPHALALGIGNWNTPMRTELIQVKPGQYFLGRTQHGHLAVAEVNMQEETTEIRWSLLVVENQAPKVVPFDNLLSVRTRKSAQDTDGPVFEVVNQFIERLRQGKKKNIDGVMGWEHVWELTTRRQGWGTDLEELCRKQSIGATVQIGDGNRMVVLTNAIKATYPEPVVGVFDLVRQDSHWRIDNEEVLPQKQAWALVDGFSRAPSVAFVVHPSNIVGTYQVIGRNRRQFTFANDGNYSELTFGPKSSTNDGTWQLEGNKLVVKTNQGTQEGQVRRLIQNGFTVDAEGHEIGYWRVAQE